MASIFRRGPKWVVEWTDAEGRRRRKTGFTDKRLTQALANRLERDVAERKAGVVPAGDNGTHGEPIAEAIRDYAADLARLGRSENYTVYRPKQVEAVAAHARWRTTRDIAPKGLSSFLTSIRAKAPNTVNSYRDAVVWFCNWLVEQGRLRDNPVARVRRGKARQARPRRAFTLDELLRLISVSSPRLRRAVLLAAYSGLRKGELEKLQARDVNTQTTPWRWRLRGEITKSGRPEDLAMLPEAEELLRELGVEAMSPTDRVLKVPHYLTMERARERAGIPKTDASGRSLDWHSLRYTFCTVLARQLPIQVVKLLMRHKDINLTARVYMDLGVEDVAEAVLKLPRLFPNLGEKK